MANHQKDTIKNGIYDFLIIPVLMIFCQIIISMIFRFLVFAFIGFNLGSTITIVVRTLVALIIVPKMTEILNMSYWVNLFVKAYDPAEFIFLWLLGETTILNPEQRKLFGKFCFPVLFLAHFFFQDSLTNWIGSFVVNKFADFIYQTIFLKAGAAFRKEYIKWSIKPKVTLYTDKIRVSCENYGDHKSD